MSNVTTCGIDLAKNVFSVHAVDGHGVNDAEAICEAVSRPSMRFVPVKSVEQQAMLTLHRVRLGFVEVLKLA